MINAELMIVFHIYYCDLYVSNLTIEEMATKGRLYCNYKINCLWNISLFKSVFKKNRYLYIKLLIIA